MLCCLLLLQTKYWKTVRRYEERVIKPSKKSNDKCDFCLGETDAIELWDDIYHSKAGRYNKKHKRKIFFSLMV